MREGRYDDAINKFATTDLLETKENRMEPRDMFGNVIEELDYINYPVRKKNDTYMRTAKVLRIRERITDHKKETVLDVAMAKAPRWWERKNGDHETKIRKVVVSNPHRCTVVPKYYIANDKRYDLLLKVK